MMRVTRRALVRWFGGLTLTSALPVAARAETPRSAAANTSMLADRLVRVYRRPHSAAAIGRAYRARCEGAPSCEAMLLELGDRLRRGENHSAIDIINDLDDAELKRRVANAIREDFAAERMIEVDGWMLARTEVQICALTAASGAHQGSLSP